MSEADQHQAEPPSPPRKSRTTASRTPQPADLKLNSPVIVVKHRSRGLSPLLLPPFAVVMLGGVFLGYRAMESNWHGFSWEQLIASWSSPGDARAVVPEPEAKPAPPLLALNADSAPLPPTETEAAPPADSEADETSKEKMAKPLPESDPIDDIRKEAEKTKERIAELEKLKEEESRKLAATENERRQADRNANANANRRAQAGRRPPPDEIRKMLDENQRRFRQQVAQMEAMQRRQMSQMAQRQRELLRRWGMEGGNGMPGPRGRQPGVPGPNLFMGMPGGDGMAEYQEFRGPGGSHGFVMKRQFRMEAPFQIPPKPDEAPTPPEPPAVPEDK